MLNNAAFVEKCIISVLGQNYDNVEYIIVDGGSTDGTIDIIQSYDDGIDFWVSEPDDGLYDAMNKGAALASGEWLNFINSDDSLVDCLAIVAEQLQRCDTIYYGDTFMKRRNILYDGYFSQYKMTISCINHQSVFFPKMVFERYRYDLKYKLFADYVLICKCNSDREIRFEYLNMMIAFYDDASGITTRCTDTWFLENRMSIVKENFLLRYYLLLKLRILAIQMLKVLGIKIMVKRLCNRVLHTHYNTNY